MSKRFQITASTIIYIVAVISFLFSNLKSDEWVIILTLYGGFHVMMTDLIEHIREIKNIITDKKLNNKD